MTDGPLPRSAAPIKIGVTGGIGAGKSTLVAAFVHRGAAPFSADTTVHELYSDPDVVAAVRNRWGERVLAEDGSVSRPAIAEIVFRDPGERRWLEGLLHPLVAAAWLRFVEVQERAPVPPEFLVAEVPLLFEAGLEDRYDAVVVVTAPTAARLERARTRGVADSLSAERAAAQMAEQEKVARADFAFVNAGDPAALDAFATRVLDALRAQQRHSHSH